jgi:hypothetical protein
VRGVRSASSIRELVEAAQGLRDLTLPIKALVLLMSSIGAAFLALLSMKHAPP